MSFKMKVKDIYRMGKITIFSGDLYTSKNIIHETKCNIEIDGNIIEEIIILGEVQTGRPQRDLLTKSPLTLTQETLLNHDVWLVGRTERT